MTERPEWLTWPSEEPEWLDEVDFTTQFKIVPLPPKPHLLEITMTRSVRLIAALLAVGTLAACGASASTGDTSAPEATIPAGVGGPSGIPAESTPAPAETTEAPAPPTYTVSQQNAIDSAQSYLDMGTGFSQKSLTDQVEFEGFPAADVKFALKHVTVDWNEQAAASAKGYMDSGSFSRKSLNDQLLFEGFTETQASYGVKSVGL